MHQVGSIYKRLYKDAQSTEHKKTKRWLFLKFTILLGVAIVITRPGRQKKKTGYATGWKYTSTPPCIFTVYALIKTYGQI